MTVSTIVNKDGDEVRKFIFQPIDWRYNAEDEKDDEETIITVTGVLENGEDIVCEVYDFEPFLIVELPLEIEGEEIEWGDEMYDKIYEWMRNLVGGKKSKPYKPIGYEVLHDYKVLQKMRTGKFIKMFFPTHIGLVVFRKYFEDKIDDEYVPHSVYCSVFGKIVPEAGFKFHESNINPLIKAIIQRDVEPSNWLEVVEHIPNHMYGCSVDERKFSTAKHDCYVNIKDLKPLYSKTIDPSFKPPIKILSFDLECFSINFNSAKPDYKPRENEVYAVGCCFADVSDSSIENYEVYILTLENPPDIPGVKLLHYKTERDLLIGFARFIKKKNPTIMMGHNILAFDWDYMINRAKLGINDCYSEFASFSKMIGEEAFCTKLSWNSSAYNNMVFKYMDPIGRINFDIYVEAQRQGYRLRSFALNSLGEAFLGEYKEDLPYKQQFMIYFLIKKFRRSKSLKECKKLIRKTVSKEDYFDENMNLNKLGKWCTDLMTADRNNFRQITKEGQKLILDYLKQDVILPMKIFHKMNMWTGAQQASNIFKVPVDYLQTRGQQIKVLAQVHSLASKEKTIIGFKIYEKLYDWAIQGALVQDITPGYHEHVLTYDFTSLYPSTIIANNICYSTLVEDFSVDPQTVNTIDWVEHKFCGCPQDPHKGKKGKNDRILCSKEENIGTEYEGRYHFQFKKVIKHKDESGKIIKRENEGVYPRFLRTLLSRRKEVKNQIKILNKWVFGKEFQSKKDRGIINKWASGQKLSSEEEEFIKKYESFCKTSKIDEKSLKLLKDAIPKNIFENSVLNRENIYALLIILVVLDKKQLAIKISANSGYGGLGAETSALCFKPGAACTTAMGRKYITQGIRHTREVFTAEKLSEIFERKIEQGFQLVYGDSVLGDEPLLLRNENGGVEIKTIAELGDESGWKNYCDEKDTDFKPLDSVASNRREKEKSYVKYDVWANGKWNPIKKVIRHKTNKKIYRVNTNCGMVDVTEDHSLLNENLEKIKPNECVVGETKLSHSYPEFQQKISFGGKKEIFESKKEAAKYFYKLKSEGYKDVFIKTYSELGKTVKDKIKVYYDAVTVSCKNDYKVNSILFLRNSNEEFVYDLETQDGIFQCGVGEMQVKNTDSFMGCFPALTISESWKMIDFIQTELDSGIFPDPIHLEFECMYGKYFQLSKKCYVSWMMQPTIKEIIEDDPDKWIITEKIQKGVVSSRRDNCRYTSQGFDELMTMALTNVDKVTMRRFVDDYTYKLMARGIKIKDLVITKGIKNFEDYENEDGDGNITLTNQGHIKLADKMKKLRGEDVQNSRLQFLFVKKSYEKLKISELKQENVIEDYTYYKNNFRKYFIEPHLLYYLTHTIESHFDKILDFKYKPSVIVHEKLDDKILKEREVIEDKIDRNKIHFLNNLLVPVPQTMKTDAGEKYQLRRQTFMNKRNIEMVADQLGLQYKDLEKYVGLLKQKHSENIIKRIQDTYGYTQHGGTRGVTIKVDAEYTKHLIKNHVKYSNVIFDLKKKFVCFEFVDPFKDSP